MSRELLKRVIAECSDEGSRSNVSTDLYCAITEYLEMPEPEPVAWMWEDGLEVYFENSGDPDHNWVPLYTTPPDQSAQISELELALARANADIESVEDRLIVKNQRLYEYNEKLAALQAKREPLSDDEISNLARGNSYPGSTQKIIEYARAIETAHGIGVNHE